tara:strand:+ start:3135 stop:3719 length:585 start_codon:yes stop_codon:yes gene_type:complete
MCLGKKSKPAAVVDTATIESEQAAQKAAADEAKAASQAEAAKAQAAAIEAAKAEAIEVYKAEQDTKRQSEMAKSVSTEEELFKAAEDKAAADNLTAQQQKEREETLKLIQSLQTNQKSLIAAQSSYMQKQTEEAESEKEVGPVLSAAAERQKRISKFGSMATRNRMSRRSGSKSRRSLITGLGGGIGYYDRFAN